MKRLLVAATAAFLVVPIVPAVAPAKKKGQKPRPHAKVLRANLEPTPVGPYQLGPQTGKAHLVDGKKNDKLSIHVRNLQPGGAYAFQVHQASGPGNPCDPGSGAAGPEVSGWTYRPLNANPAGNANSKGRSRTFSIQTGVTYYVDVHDATGRQVACGVLSGKKGKKAKKPGKPGKKGNGGGKPGKGNGEGKPGKGPK